MGELIRSEYTSTMRWHLMGGVCASVLVAATSGNGAYAANEERPTIWIELGGQLERTVSSQEQFSPPFASSFSDLPIQSPLSVQHTPSYSYGTEGRLTVSPTDTRWKFSASIRYGRAKAHNKLAQQLPFKTAIERISKYGQSFDLPVTAQLPTHANSSGTNESTHAVIDFEAGRDVGLGLLGSDGSSALSLGIRIAQFSTHSTAQLSGVPYYYLPNNIKYYRTHHRYLANAEIDRSFRAIGPSIEWTGSQPVLRNGEDVGVSLDWGINVAFLFGRQKVTGHHQTTGIYYKSGLKYRGEYSRYQKGRNIARSRSVVIPNLGGSAGLSINYINAKLSLGYRADFFFGAMDGGIDARKTYDRNFYGPFATISIGLGG